MHRSATAGRTGKALILGTDTRVVLAILRSLGRQGVECHVAWLDENSIALRSRYLHRFHEIPGYSPANELWKERLKRLLEDERFDLVLPCNDSTLVPLQLHRGDFERFPEIHLHENEVFEIVSDKAKSFDLAQRLGINVAPAVRFDGAASRSLSSQLTFPAIVKPLTTFDGVREDGQSNVVLKVENRDDLERTLRTPPYDRGCLVQEFFQGVGMGVEALVDEGRILAAHQHQRLHETMSFGSSYRKSVPLDPELYAAAEKLMSALRYTGVAMIEYLYDLQTKRWIFVEINGRFWGSLPLAVNAGADFPWFLYRYWVQGERSFPRTYRTNVRCRNLLLDWQGRKTRKPTGRSRAGDLLDDAFALATLRDHLDSFAWDDVRPAFSEIGDGAVRAVRKAVRRLRRGSATLASGADGGSIAISAETAE